MKIQVQKWGNSLALRIPKTYAQEAKVKEGSAVDLSCVEGKLVLTPLTRSSYNLKNLLAGVTKENVHHEHDFGQAMGREVW